MNKVILVGRLTKDPELRYSQAAEPVAVARYTVAVNRRFKRDGEPDADFINCVVFGKQGEFAEKYFKKGMMVAISGRLQVRSWDDQNNQRHWTTEVVVDDQEFAESKSSFQARRDSAPMDDFGADYSQQPPSRPQSAQQRPQNFEPEGFTAIADSIEEDDLPF